MATSVLAAGTTAANSADITIGDSGVLTLFLTTAAGGSVPFGAKAVVELKSAAGGYMIQGELNSSSMSYNLHAAPGTLVRVRRLAGGPAVGVDQG